MSFSARQLSIWCLPTSKLNEISVGETLYPQSPFNLITQVIKWVLANLTLGVAHPGGSRNTPSLFMLQKLR